MPGVHPDFALGVTFKLPLTSAEFSRCIQVTSWGAALNLPNPLWVQCCCGLAWPGPPPTSHSLPLVHTRPPSPLHILSPWSTPGPSPLHTLCPWSSPGHPAGLSLKPSLTPRVGGVPLVPICSLVPACGTLQLHTVTLMDTGPCALFMQYLALNTVLRQ